MMRAVTVTRTSNTCARAVLNPRLLSAHCACRAILGPMEVRAQCVLQASLRPIQYRAAWFAMQARFQRKLVPRPVRTVPRASTMLMLPAQRTTTTQMRTVPSVRLARTALQAHQVVWRAPLTQTRFRGAHPLRTVRVTPGQPDPVEALACSARQENSR